MQSTLISRPGDDPHDIVAVAPDAVRVAPAEDELSSLLHQAARLRSDLQVRAAPGVAAAQAVPEVDTTFRPTAAGDVQGNSWPMARRALRGLMALLLAVGIGLAGVAWKAYGDVAKKQIAKWGTQIVLIASLSPDKPALSAPPAAPATEVDAANAAPEPPAAPAEAEAAAPAAAPSPDQAQQLQSMASDLASVSQQVEQLKASIAELKASQQQMSRDLAKAAEQNARPRIAALPPRPAVARPRKPTPLYPPPQVYPPPQAATAPPLPQAPAPYYASRQPDYAPRQPEPPQQFGAEPPGDPELTSVPRPPMPLR